MQTLTVTSLVSDRATRSAHAHLQLQQHCNPATPGTLRSWALPCAMCAALTLPSRQSRPSHAPPHSGHAARRQHGGVVMRGGGSGGRSPRLRARNIAQPASNQLVPHLLAWSANAGVATSAGGPGHGATHTGLLALYLANCLLPGSHWGDWARQKAGPCREPPSQ